MRVVCCLTYALAATTSCTDPDLDTQDQGPTLGFAQAQWLSLEASPESATLVGDMDDDGWFDILLLAPDESPSVVLAVPELGLSLPATVAGLPSARVRQAELVALSNTQRLGLSVLEHSGRLRLFDSLSPAQFKEIDLGVKLPAIQAYAWADLDADGWLDLIVAHELDAASGPFGADAGLDAGETEAGKAIDPRQPKVALAVWLGQANGSYELGGEVYVTENNDGAPHDEALLHVADIDFDGDLDLAVALPGVGVGIVLTEIKPQNDMSGADAGGDTTPGSEGLTGSGDAGPGDAGPGDADPGDAGPGDADSGDAGSDAGGSPSTDPMGRVHRLELRFSPLRDEVDWTRGGTGFQLTDRDGDGDADWFHFASSQPLSLLSNDGAGQFAVDPTPVPAAGRGCVEDFTNDGYLDVLAATTEGLELWTGKSGLSVRYERAASLDGLTEIRSVVCVDIDKDGDVDVLSAGSEGVALFINTLDPIPGSDANFFGFRLEGTVGNRSALGARLELSSGNDRQVKVLTASGQAGMPGSPALHFGLGAATSIDRVRLTWPNGEVQQTDDFGSANDVVVVAQPE